MPSFDVVSEVDLHELTNAVDQTNREVSNRFDLKETCASVEQDGHALTIIADAEFHIAQIHDILQGKITKRGLDIACLQLEEVETTINSCKQRMLARQGIDKNAARKIVKLAKETKLKVQAQIQQDQVRISGKKRNDLQVVMAQLKKTPLDLPIQFTNFRD
ncbi:MAG TPA: YajQ family cyclic di-GMP-binding protein [Gammaproteobacteria bacterium]|nr:YajQ family cyclic di-GMP-binding protein [Gammaproteobacteria bacterium]|tara:strand:- start:747 stop:1229 length:483 start_codon:yes stop_codon:yes gene_type:complete